jgi:hypothetical protein
MYIDSRRHCQQLDCASRNSHDIAAGGDCPGEGVACQPRTKSQHGVEWNVLKDKKHCPDKTFAYMQLSKQAIGIAFCELSGTPQTLTYVNGTLAYLGNADHPPEG